MIKYFLNLRAFVSVFVMLGLAACATTPHGLTAAQIAVLQQQGFKQTNNGWELGLADKILFAENSDKLTPETESTIGQIGQALLSVQLDELHIEGHTDNYGTDSYNDDLSLRRADAVAAALERVGFLSTNLQVQGLGKLDPVADNNTAEGRSENRRVSLIIPPDFE